jgi:putative ABC transport system permease protein
VNREFVAATVVNLRMLPKRWGSALIACIGVACVVMVFIGMLSVAASFERLLLASSYDDTSLVMRRGATNEVESSLNQETVQAVTGYAQALERGSPASPELVRAVRVKRESAGDLVDIQLRGVTPAAREFRKEFRVVAGRDLTPALTEVIVGRAAQRQFANLGLGQKVRLIDADFTVVGVFEANGSASESELWTSLDVLQSAMHSEGTVNSLRVRVNGGKAEATFQKQLDEDPRTNAFAQRESVYFGRAVRSLTDSIRYFGAPVFVIMLLGALFAALNTMYGAIKARAKELATMRALGFGRGALVAALVVESMLLALAGGIVGTALVVGSVGGLHANSSFLSETQYAFTFVFSWALVARGLTCALSIGLIGGFLPALGLASIPPARAFREV